MVHFLLVLSAVTAALVQTAWGDGAGRAFPVDSENFVIEAFKKVNPALEWDKTNFLVDLSGQFANCKQRTGAQKADRKTPNGFPIDVLVDTTPGKESDTKAVDKYIREVIKRWVDGGHYHSQLRAAKRFGCSVRPACTGLTVVACVFSEDTGDKKGDITENGNNGHNDRNKTEKDEGNGNGLDGQQQKALAFTPEQYQVAESILGNKWDRSHFLEDLSGFETDCEMIGRHDWPFDKIKKTARERNVKVSGQYGTAPNKGSTPDALKEILSRFKPLSLAKQMGCSIIPDCKSGGSLVVVIACLYEE